MECYFEILMPSSKVKRAKERRDIQVHDGELTLANYKWSLKNWDGDLLATQHFMVSSEGEAAKEYEKKMGRYTLCTNIVMQDNTPVYKHDDSDIYLYRIRLGSWCLNDIAGQGSCYIIQMSNGSPSPHKTIPWQYWDNGWQEDETLRVYPCY